MSVYVTDNPLYCKTHGKGLHVAQLNTRSMLSNNKLDLLLKNKNQAYSEVGIFTLSETWLIQAIPSGIVEVGPKWLCVG